MSQATLQAIPTRDQIALEDTWDLSTIYANEDAWNAELASAPAAIEQAVAFRGRLGESAEVTEQALQAVFDLQLQITRLVVYASLKRDEDTALQESSARYEKAVMISIQAGEALSFLQPEIISLPGDVLKGLIDSPDLATYKHLLEDLDRQRAHVRSAEVEEVLAQFSDVTRAASEAFGQLDNADLKFGEIEDENGQLVELSKGRYAQAMESKDRAYRKRAFEKFISAYKSHANVIASLHSSSVRKDVAGARIRNYDSALQEALAEDNIPDVVYDNLINTVQGKSDVIARSNALRKKLLGVDELMRYDLRVPLSPAPTLHYDYREAVEIVLAGAEALGEQYVSDLRSGFNSRWVDVHETKGKRGGAYSWSVYGAPPVMLMNWNGTQSDVFTLTHEAGHAMHSFYSMKAQPFHLAGYPIFLAEIASTVNEVLLGWHLLGREEAKDPIVRFGLLNRFTEGFEGTIINQTMFADFEKRTHGAAEAGHPLTLDFLNEQFGEVQEIYGKGITVDEESRANWSRIPHFYRAFYVYQYATGLSAAINIARAVRDEGDAARDRYLQLLSSGGSDYPIDLLKRAGVDLSTPHPIEVAFEEYEAAIAEMEHMVDAGTITLPE